MDDKVKVNLIQGKFLTDLVNLLLCNCVESQVIYIIVSHLDFLKYDIVYDICHHDLRQIVGQTV